MAATKKSEHGDDPGTKAPEVNQPPDAAVSRTAKAEAKGSRRFGRTSATVTKAATVTPGADGGPAPPTFVIGGPAVSAWREQALTRIAELRTLTLWVRAHSDDEGADELVASIEAHLDAAEEAAGGTAHLTLFKHAGSWISGAPVERTGSNCEAAEADLLRLAPLWYLRGQMPSLQVAVRKHLPADDPRRVRLEELARATRTQELQPSDRDVIVTAVRGATSAGRREITRVRSFRNVLYVAAAMLATVAVLIAIIGWRNPDALPICFAP